MLRGGDKIDCISPNPASTNIQIDYTIDEATSAYLEITPLHGGSSYNHILNTTSDDISIDVSGYPTGYYVVVLVVDGQPIDSENLLIE